MKATKKWIKDSNSPFAFTFFINEQEAGRMDISVNSLSRKAECVLNDRKFTIRRTGFWKSTIEIADANGLILAKAYYEKWYANVMALEFQGQIYKLKIRNNPLAEYVILKDDREVLAYGLHVDDKKPVTKITPSTEKADLIFDFLLWYLFVPIAFENSSDDITFLLMIA